MALPGGTPPGPRRPSYTRAPDWPTAVRVAWLVFVVAGGIAAVASPVLLANVPWLR